MELGFGIIVFILAGGIHLGKDLCLYQFVIFKQECLEMDTVL